MSLIDLPVLDMLRAKMKWHQARQRVLAENVANADTPGYAAQDLRSFEFERYLQPERTSGLTAVRTNAAHIGGTVRADTGIARLDAADFETTPSGNAVVLEEQMMQVAANQMDYQMATSLYAKSIGLLRVALGRGA